MMKKILSLVLALAVMFSSFFSVLPVQRVHAQEQVDKSIYMDPEKMLKNGWKHCSAR